MIYHKGSDKMYLNSKKSDTNIDKEFKKEKKLSSGIKKNKVLIFIILAIILVIIMILIFLLNRDKNYLVLNGDNVITIYQESDYIEQGFKAYTSKNKDLTSSVIIKSTLDTSKVGEYEITYTLGNITKTRIINVIEKPEEYTYIYLKPVNDDVNIYLKVGEEYHEPGYQVFNSSGKDLTEEVKVTGTVDTSKKGNYKLIYSVMDSNNATISVTRTVVVE